MLSVSNRICTFTVCTTNAISDLRDVDEVLTVLLSG